MKAAQPYSIATAGTADDPVPEREVHIQEKLYYHKAEFLKMKHEFALHSCFENDDL